MTEPSEAATHCSGLVQDITADWGTVQGGETINGWHQCSRFLSYTPHLNLCLNTGFRIS